MGHIFITLAESNNSIATDLEDTFLSLFPAWPTLLTAFLAFIIVFIGLYKFVWQPVRKSMAERRAFIQKNIDESIINLKESERKKNEANELLETNRVKAYDSFVSAKIEAEKMRNLIIAEAQKKADRILIDAETEVKSNREKLRLEVRTEMVEVALEAAKKVAQKEVDNKNNREFINQFISEELV